MSELITKKRKIKKSDIDRGYIKQPSLVNYLPWQDYNEKLKLFLLEDNQSLAAGFEIKPIACEAKPSLMMEEILKSIAEAVKNAIRCEKDNPWILQCFVERQFDLSGHYEQIEKAVIETAKASEKNMLTPLQTAYLKTLKEHLAYVSRDGGIFTDRQVTNHVFRGGYLSVRCFLYQRISNKSDKLNPKKKGFYKDNLRKKSVQDILKLLRKFTDQLHACGLKMSPLTGNVFYDWMVKWFNPKFKYDFLKKIEATDNKKNDENKKPFGYDLSEQIFFKAPQSFDEGWLFDGQPHKVLTVQSLSAEPSIGHLTAERKRATDDKVFNLMDHLPQGSVLSLNIVFQSPSEVDFHLKGIEESAIGSHALALKVKNEVEDAQTAIANGDPLLPFVMAVYIKGENVEALKEHEAQIEVLLNSNGFKVITDDELFPIDAYLRYLPMSYDFNFDKKHACRSRYVLLSDICKLLPFYGRSTGTEHPSLIAFNRGGEPWFYDIYKDKTKNGHFLLLGETGTGKSNLLNFMLMGELALYNPRLFIIEAGGSFDIFGDYCQSLGLTVNKVKIDPSKPVSLNPFAQGLKVLDDKNNSNKNDSENDTENENEESRDILGEMVIAALLMITGGEKKEEARIRRSDRMLVMDAIIKGAEEVKKAGRSQMIAADVVKGFSVLTAELDPSRESDKIKRADEMADSLRYFVQDPLSSQFFNTPGDPWPLADITIVDMGKFAQEGYEAHRSVAFAGCVSRALELAEVNQAKGRPTRFISDEDHLTSHIPLLAAMKTRITKMGRKLGLWFGASTQNMKDFADEAHKMLSMMETFICLALPPDEIDQVERFKPLTPEQRALILSAQKEKGKYTEGVLLSPTLQGLFRHVPPRLYLAMAATEQSEKTERRHLREKLNLTDLQAVEYIAQQMMEK